VVLVFAERAALLAWGLVLEMELSGVETAEGNDSGFVARNVCGGFTPNKEGEAALAGVAWLGMKYPCWRLAKLPLVFERPARVEPAVYLTDATAIICWRPLLASSLLERNFDAAGDDGDSAGSVAGRCFVATGSLYARCAATAESCGRGCWATEFSGQAES